jgi:hypothetical protein
MDWCECLVWYALEEDELMDCQARRWSNELKISLTISLDFAALVNCSL